jgi:hypothetical protein
MSCGNGRVTLLRSKKRLNLSEEARLSRSLTTALAGQSFLTKELEMSRSIAKIFEDQGVLAKQFRVPEALTSVMASTGVSAMLESLRKNDFLTRASIGPVADLEKLGFLSSHKDYLQEFGISHKLLSSLDARFRIPEVSETVRLANMFSATEASKAFAALVGPSLSVQRAMESMSTPWLDIANPGLSASAFAAIQDMGSAISRVRAYDADLSSALRLELGDWRTPIAWPASIFTDLEARSKFYVSLGVNVALTNMPSPAFRESLGIAELWEAPPALIDGYEESETEEPEGSDEAAFARTNEAHDRLQRLESQLRKFIDDVMIREFGSDWPKHRVHPDVVAAWREKKQRAQRYTDADLPLIAYADFSDYERVICRRDNWRLFEVYFDRQESVRESFQRLYPIRIDTMHSRLITQDDELFLAVECKRLMKALGKRRQ